LKGLRLKKLDLKGCGLTDTTALHDLPSSLTALNVSKNYLHPDIIIRLAGLTQLTELNVSDCGVRDDIFGRLRNLKTLNAAGNDIDEVRITCDLERLDLSSNKRHLILRGKLSALTTLIMGCSNGANGLKMLEPSMWALTSAEKLEVLEISNMHLDELQSLEILIGGNRGLNRLALKSVFVCNKTNADMERILASLGRITWLEFGSTNLGFSFVKALAAYGQPMVALTTLIISVQSKRIDDDIAAFTRALQLLPALKALNMQGALQRANSVMTVLKCAPEHLTDLNLANNPFYPLDKGQVAARSALELCMSELHRFEHLTSVAISYPSGTKLSLVGDGSVPPTIVENAV
jgi:Leucine-rich repeat (LRR) protein